MFKLEYPVALSFTWNTIVLKLRFVANILSTLLLLLTARTYAETPPNIVLIISDDQAWNDYGFMGHETIQTPNLDRLAAESVTTQPSKTIT